ncbi:AI-2E family transporter [Candidatus Pacearchaeota archaeon]|nr:AI-2E family transporter [Candidatus Pacearchaeota archaeon]
MIDEKTFKKLSIFLVIGVLLILTFIVLRPIASAVIIGLILAYVFLPVYKRILSVVREKSISALLVIFLVLLLIFIPLWFLLPAIIKEVFDIYLYTQEIDVLAFLRGIIPSLSQIGMTQNVAVSLNSFLSNLVSKILSSASNTLYDLPGLGLKLAVVLFVFFFGMRDAEIFKRYVASLSPFSKSTEEDISSQFKSITRAVIFGYFVVGVIQGIFTGIGLFIFGIPQALLLTFFAIIASIIPMVGAWLIWIPASIYLIISGHVFAGIGLALYGGLFVSWIDNVLRVYLVSRSVKISSGIVIIGMIGGFLVFGLLGFILGPLILSYLLLVLNAYREKKFPSLFSE